MSGYTSPSEEGDSTFLTMTLPSTQILSHPNGEHAIKDDDRFKKKWINNEVLPTVQHRKLYPVSWERPQWKIMLKKEHMHDCVILLYSRNWHNIVNKL